MSEDHIPLLERLRKYRANVDSLERINNAFILVGKIAFITVATCIMLLTCHAGFRTESIAPANLVDSLRCHTLHRFFSCGGTMMTFACLILIQIAVIIIGFVYIFWIKHVLKLQNEALNGIKPTPSLRKIPISVKK